MRCHICNTKLSAAEVQFNKDHQDFDPCTKCLDVIQGVFNDDTEDEIDRNLNYELEIIYETEDDDYSDAEETSDSP